MAALGLAQLIALIQDGLQRSYSFIEDVAEASRDGRREGVMLTVGEVSLSIPVAFSVRTQGVDLTHLLKPERTATAFSLSRLLLTAPMADPELRKVLRGQAYSAIAQARPGLADMEEDRTAARSEAKEAKSAERVGGGSPEKTGFIPTPTLEIRFSDLDMETLRRTTKAGKLAEPELAVTVLGEEAGRTPHGTPGRLEIRFKPVLD